MAAASAWRFATNTPHRLSLRLTARLLRLPLKACLPVCWPGRPNRQGGVINRGDTRPSFLVQPSRLSGQAVVSRDGRVVRYQHPPPPQPSPDGSASATPPQGGSGWVRYADGIPGAAVAFIRAGRCFARCLAVRRQHPHRISLRLAARLPRLPLKACLPVCPA